MWENGENSCSFALISTRETHSDEKGCLFASFTVISGESDRPQDGELIKKRIPNHFDGGWESSFFIYVKYRPSTSTPSPTLD